ncbi:Virus attachment protein p12 family protein [Ruminococcus sp. YE71]|uniref:FeoB-associated Cys-rich membrane protein n=1 Tax=unclassified Ruminococcus TaxID=2608920 RepID=UPI00087ED8BE|nr:MULTISPECIES: FeoB-associated Cys-rich membrane protein [unclassified Ruminococcus]SDA13783.1 Virus attachment protein p12 family protein [Ruminococcus sp. YE78]SFW19688.1 Virus attachment protein p12 family protein [Ruminococcus sp. YE71]
MNAADIVLTILIAAAVILAARALVKRSRKGGCGCGCDTCTAKCSQCGFVAGGNLSEERFSPRPPSKDF